MHREPAFEKILRQVADGGASWNTALKTASVAEALPWLIADALGKSAAPTRPSTSKETRPMKRRLPERATRAIHTILTTLGETIERLEDDCDHKDDNYIKSIDEALARESKLDKEIERLKAELAASEATVAKMKETEAAFASEIGALSKRVYLLEDEARTKLGGKPHQQMAGRMNRPTKR